MGAHKKIFRPNNMLLKVEAKKKLSLLKLRKEQHPGSFVTAIIVVKIEYRNNFTKDDKVSALVSALEPPYGATILNKMERLEGTKGEEVMCDTLVEYLCKLWRDSGSGKGIIEAPAETKWVDPGYCAKDKACFCCKENGHLKFECLKLVRKQSGNK